MKEQDKRAVEHYKKLVDQLMEMRCTHCNRLLGKVSGAAEIKCPKCGAMNVTKRRVAM